MSRKSDRAGRNNWRVEFIQPATPGSDRCIMLYGQKGEIVGPLTIALAEAWMDQFDNSPEQTSEAARPAPSAAADG
jgi:hypothetical protein